MYYILHTQLYTNQTHKKYILYIYTYIHIYTHSIYPIQYNIIQYNMYTHTHTNITHITHAYIPTFKHYIHEYVYTCITCCIYIRISHNIDIHIYIQNTKKLITYYIYTHTHTHTY